MYTSGTMHGYPASPHEMSWCSLCVADHRSPWLMEEAEWWAQDTAEGRSLHRQLQKRTDTLPQLSRGCNCKCQSQSLRASDLYTAPLCFPDKSEAPNSGNPVPKAGHPKAHLSQATGRQNKGLLPRANTSAHLRLGSFLENNCYGFCLL